MRTTIASFLLSATWLSTSFVAAAPSTTAPEPWPLWNAYVKAFASEDGRFIDRGDRDRTTSEAQAYALFLSLVANDRAQFERTLKWTEQNLAKGDLRYTLPAWHWGRGDNDRWYVLDDCPASDADLWMAYALLEAGRLWCEPRFSILAQQIAAQVARHEVTHLPGLGPFVLPGSRGFKLDSTTWRLNPSYLPLPILRRFEAAKLTGPWQDIIQTTLRMIRDATTRDGFIANWVLYRADTGFVPDEPDRRIGSYDAIRNYLWAGMISDQDPDKSLVAGRLLGLYRFFKRVGHIPEGVDTVTQTVNDRHGTVGFYASMLPLARDMGDDEVYARLARKMAEQRQGDLYGSPPKYYEHNLILFAQGFVEGRYRFAPDGRLEPRWEKACTAP